MRTRSLLAVSAGVLVILTLFLVNGSVPANAEAALLAQAARLDGARIFFAESSGEASRFDRSTRGLSRFAGLLGQLGAELYTLEWRNGLPADADVLVIPGPSIDLTSDQVARLYAYLDNGGKVLLLANPPIEGVTSGGRTAPLTGEVGLFALLWADFGVRGRSDLVVTQGDLQPFTLTAEDGLQTVIDAPTLITNFTAVDLNVAHPVIAGLSGVTFFGARSFEVDGSLQAYNNTPLVFSDRSYYGETNYPAYVRFRQSGYEIGTDTPPGSLALAVAFESGRTGARLIAIGDREMATNGLGLQVAPEFSAGFVYPDNVRLLLNSMAWLLNTENPQVSFPTAGPTSTPTLTPTVTPTLLPTLPPGVTATATFPPTTGAAGTPGASALPAVSATARASS